MTGVDTTEDYDPFEEFNRSAGMGIVDNPYPLFALARRASAKSGYGFSTIPMPALRLNSSNGS